MEFTQEQAVTWTKEEASTWRLQASEEQSAGRLAAAEYATEQAAKFDAIAAMLEADVEVRRTLKRVHDVTLTLVSYHDDCDDCAARSEWEEEPHDEVCRAHGTEGSAVVRALMAARDILGPCVCGHAHQDHESVDSTRCSKCGCDAFIVPEPATCKVRGEA